MYVCACFPLDKGKVDFFKKIGAEIGKHAAKKSGGLFSAEDWQCTMYSYNVHVSMHCPIQCMYCAEHYVSFLNPLIILKYKTDLERVITLCLFH